MESKKWTKEQADAITMEGNLLVSAAAGAGKTAVMTERIARIIAEGTRVEELLVVTYTKPAAAEMKQRIEKRLSELCDAEENPEKKRLLTAAAASVSRANISTIHSFCTNVLRRSYHLVGLDPVFRVGDDAETALIMNEALDEATEEFYLAAEKNGDEASAFIKNVFDNNDGLRDIITSIYRFVIARPEPEEFIKKAVSYYGENFDEAAEIAEKFILREAQMELATFKGCCERVFNANREILTGKETGYLDILNRDMQEINELLCVDSYEKMQWRLENFKLSPLRVGKLSAPDDIKSYRKQFKETIAKLCEVFATPLAVERRTANALLPVIELIADLVLDFMQRFADKKRQEAVIDFSDMEQMTLKALSFDETAEEYRQKFKYVFIDEYQDTNLVQDSIIAKISRGDNLFMVGDVKQSIYRFRQAEPASFLNKYREYDGSIGTRIDLNNNFRSCTAILNAANSLFSKLMLGDIGEIDYSDNAALRPGDNKTAGKVELTLIELSPEAYKNAVGEQEEAAEEDGDDGALAEIDNIEAEGAFIADKIRELMQTSSVFDKETGAMRQPVFSDFAVLMRRTRVPALRLINTLTERGIPCSAELGDGYFDALEVQVFINLLRVIDNARQDIPLVSVLRSPMFGFTDEELVKIRTDAPGEAFIDRLFAAADRVITDGDSAPSGSIKAAQFLQKLFDWRRKSGLVSVETLVGDLFDETRYYICVGAMPGGAVRQANLDLLLDRSRAFAASGRRGVHAFVNMLDSVRDNTNMGAAQAASVDAVRVMSIHKSKGLEFPIVFLCGLTGEFSRANSRSSVVTDSELGVGLRINRGFRLMEALADIPAPAIKNPLFRRAIEAKDASRQSAEEMRVLYVAMTRAREQLYMVGAKKKLAQLIKNASPLTEHSIMCAKCYLQWIVGAYFPFGLNLQNAAQGVTVPVGDDALMVKFILEESADGGDVRVKKAAFEHWKEGAKAAEHGAIDEKLSFVYPFIEDTGISAKSSVTGVSEAEREYVPALPAFIRNEEGHRLTAAERGTATHRLIQLLPKEAVDRESVEKALASFTEKGLFKKEEAAAVDLFAVTKLVSSKLYRRLLVSDFVRREQEFSLMEENGALIQGIIDCFFKEGDGLVLVDYKTTSTKERKPEEVAESYSGQLGLYAKALERLTGLPVKEKWVYLLSVPGAYRLK